MEMGKIFCSTPGGTNMSRLYVSTSFSTESVVASRTFRSPLFAHIDVGMPPSFSATTTLQYFLSFGSLYPSTLQTPFPASVLTT